MRKTQSHNQHFLFLKDQVAAYQSQAKQGFKDKHPRATQWLEKRQLDVGKIRQQSQRLLTGATLSSLLLLAAPQAPSPLPQATEQRRLARVYLISAQDIKSRLAEALALLVPARVGHPDPDNEIQVSQVIEEN